MRIEDGFVSHQEFAEVSLLLNLVSSENNIAFSLNPEKSKAQLSLWAYLQMVTLRDLPWEIPLQHVYNN